MIKDIQELNFPSYATMCAATCPQPDMGEWTITSQIRIDGQIAPDFSYDWEVLFQGHKYIQPLRKPQGSKDNEKFPSVINLTFQHWAIWQLKRWSFVTMQPIDSGTAVADEEVADVSLNLKDFCGLFAQVLAYYYGDKITLSLNPEWQYKEEAEVISISHTKVWNVLAQVFYEKFGVRWDIKPNGSPDKYVIRIGYPTTEQSHIFEYGFEGGLMKVERQTQSEEITNMLKGRGGEKNLPFRYFKNTDPNNPDFAPDPDWIEELANIPFTRLMPATFRSYVQGWKAAHISKYPGYPPVGEANAYSPWAYRKGYTDTKFHPVEFVADEITVNPVVGDRQMEILPGYSPFVKKGSSLDKYGPLLNSLDDNDEIFPTIQGVIVNPYGRIDQTVAVEPITSDDIADSAESDAQITTFRQPWPEKTEKVAKNSRKTIELTGTWFSVPTGKTANFDEGNKVVKITKDNLRVFYDFKNRKWLIGNQEVAVDYDNVVIKETSVVLENTIGQVVSASGIPSGTYRYKVTCKVHNTATEDYNITVSLENPKLTDATLDDKWSNVWHIWVKNIWQTSKKQGETDKQYAERVWRPILGNREGNEAKVMFTSGALAISDDYEFTIVSTPEYDTSKTLDGVQSHWKITLAKSDADLESLGVYLPSTMRQAIAGDYFVFLGIDPQYYYTDWAERRLDDWKKDNLRDKSDIKPTWVVQTDRVRLNGYGKEDALIRQLHPGDTLRLADKRFIEGAYETLYLSSLTYTYREPTSEDAALNPDVEIVLSDRYEVSANIVSTLQGEVSALAKQVGSISNVEQIVRMVGDKLYLRKDGLPDRSLSPTEFASLLTSLGFRSGMVGGAGWGIYKDANGNWVIEADRFMARQDLEVNNLIINQVLGKGGTEVDCAAFMEITRVEELDNGYKCYFDQHEGTVANLFHVDDVAWNNRYTPENADLKFYRRRVTEVGADYVVLTKPLNGSTRPSEWPDSGVNGVGIPAEGDVIVHRGNYTDKQRQYIKVRDVVGGGYERYIEGLDSVNAEGTGYYFVGRQAGVYNGRPRFYLGDENGYIEWVNGVLNIKGKIVATSTIDGKTLNQYFTDLIPEISQEDIEGYVNAITKDKFENLQSQIDGSIMTYFQHGVPTLSNYPANEWGDNQEKDKHLGDLYYDKNTGFGYRFEAKDGGGYEWALLKDTDIAKALAAAAQAQDTADGKRRTFTPTAQHPTPYPPYDEGDMWVNATYGNQYKNDILRCITPKAEGQSFAIGDWTLASKYTDDSALNDFIKSYEKTIEEVKTQLDGKSETWYQAEDPSKNTRKSGKGWMPEADSEHVGDLWYCTVDIAGTNFKKGTKWYWDGTQWKEENIPDSVFDKIDGKADIFVAKPTSYHANDLWFLESNYTLSDGAHKAGTLAVAIKDMGADGWKASDWAKKDRYTDDTLAQSAKDEIAGYAYIKEALKGNTVINGGLVLSSLIKLGIWTGEGEKATLSKVYAGINGVRKTDKSPFLWGGGDMVDKYYDANGNARTTALESGFAASLLRMDGSAYFAKGNIGFNADGSGWLGGEDKIKFGADGSMVFGSGIKINLNTGEKGLKETIESFANILTYFIPEDSTGKTVAWGGNVARIRVTKGFYSDSFISARGANPDGGASGGATQLRMLDDVLLGTNLASGQALVYNGTKWVNQAIQQGLNTTELANYLTTNNYAKKSDIPSLSPYLKSADAATLYQPVGNYLTSHQAIHALTLQSGTFSAKTYTPNSAAQTVNIPTTTSHITEGTRLYFTDARAQSALASTVSGINTAIDGKVSKAGDTMSGALQSTALINIASGIPAQGLFRNGFGMKYSVGNDGAWLRFDEATTNSGWLEIATGDDGSEPIYVRQYNTSNAIVRTATLLDASGNTSFPGQVTAQSWKIGDCEITWDSANGGLKFSKGIYSESYVSARGANSSGGSSSGGGVSYNRLDNWADYATSKDGYVLSAKLGYDLYSNKADKSWVENKGYLTSQSLDFINIKDIRGTEPKPNNMASKKVMAWFNNTDKPSATQTWYSGITVYGWNSHENYTVWQLGANADSTTADKNLYFRLGRGETWESWQTVVTSDNISSYLASYAKLQSPNNLIHAGNEFTIIPNGFSYERIWFNYRAGDGTTNATQLKEYIFGNGTKGGFAKVIAAGFKISGGTASQVLMADGSTKTVHCPTTTSHLGWAGTKGQLTTIDTIAFWNGRYNDATSNLQYCDRGRFGTMAVANASDYLPLTGGTLTGQLFIKSGNDTKLILNNTDTEDKYQFISFQQNGTTYGYLGTSGSDVLKWNANTIWHSGNDGAGSGLDADLLDGVHNGNLTSAYTHNGSIKCYRTFTKNDNSGWPTYLILADVTATYNASANGAHYGFVGTIYHERHGGYSIGEVVQIAAKIGYNSSSMQLSSSATSIQPCILQNGSNYYLALRIVGSGHEYYMHGYEINLPSSFTQINCTNSSGTLPSGYSVKHSGSGSEVWGNASSATKLATARSIWGQNFNGEGNVSGALSGVTSISMTNNINAARTNKDVDLGLFVSSDGRTTAFINGTSGRRGIFDTTNSRWAFSIETNGNTSLMGGNVGINTSNPTQKLEVNGNAKVSYLYASGIFLQNPTAQKGFYFDISNTGIMWIGKHDNYGSLALMMQFNPNNKICDIVGTLHTSVGMYSDGYVSARGQNTSDIRLKTDIRDFNATDIIKALQPKAFRWNSYAKSRFEVFRTDEVQYGLIAQEADKVAPWLVDRNMFNDGLWGVHYERLIPVLTQGVKEVAFTVDDLLVRVRKLERENRELKRKIEILERR